MRLIDADALINAIRNRIAEEQEIYPDDKISRLFRVGMRSVIGIVKNQDTIDPVKHGHWIHSSSTEPLTVSCSNCGYKVNYFWDSWQDALHCPHCGARMDGDAND